MSETTERDAHDDTPPMEAARYSDGSITYPPHPLGPDGEQPVDTVDLSEYTATIVTWTTSTATPPGVRAPNSLAIVEFDVDGEPVGAIGQLDVDDENPDVAIGDEVEPVYAEELRDPDAGIREKESQEWDGYRFRPVR
ncbi:OB-fold domain-containing protein [Haloprofundus salinisoli]|uniref:OB-fold domain-containing protein n=1 Tax=Haloprofundus salinisoli TaxID=2876193 RepID=UPI001CCFBF54|nr:OB-fold domain-containing protein [Haloprofundus salinisoli]